MSGKELFFIAMAALGGYAAYLQIMKEKNRAQGVNNDLFSGAFSNNEYDFYG